MPHGHDYEEEEEKDAVQFQDGAGEGVILCKNQTDLLRRSYKTPRRVRHDYGDRYTEGSSICTGVSNAMSKLIRVGLH